MKYRVALLRPSSSHEDYIPYNVAQKFVIDNLPILEIVPIEKSLPRIIKHLEGDVDCIAFMSKNAVKTLMILGKKYGILEYLLKQLTTRKLAAIGESTAKMLIKYGLRPTILPKRFTSIDLGYEIIKHRVRKVLIPRSQYGNDRIIKILSEHGIEVVNIPIYTLKVHERAYENVRKVLENYNIIVFTSSLIVDTFLNIMEENNIKINTLKNKIIVSIGPVTSKKLELHGILSLVPRKFSMEGILELLRNLT